MTKNFTQAERGRPPVLVKSEVTRRLKLNKTCFMWTRLQQPEERGGLWITYEVCDPSP